MKKNIAVVGTGYWGKNLVRNFYDLGALHTVCDTDSETVKSFLSQYSGTQGTTSFSSLLQNKNISGVVIATPAETHFYYAKEAMLSGKDVLVEKPLCLDEHEGEELIELAEKHAKILMTGHLLWYHPVILKLKAMIENGEFGRILYIYSNRLNLGKLRREENVLWSFAPHDISVILGLVGENPQFIQAQGGNYLHQQIADTTVTLLDFPSGIKAHIFVSWLHPFKEQKLVVVGEGQMAVFDDTLPWAQKLVVYPHSVEWNDNIPTAFKEEGKKIIVEKEEPLRTECLHFLECTQTRKSPRTDGKEGLQVLQTLNNCQKALESQCRIQVSKKRPFRKQEYFVHETAQIDHNVIIGNGTKIWHYSHLLTGCNIGERCSIGQNVVIGDTVKIGNYCKIQNNVSVYKGVELEDNVFCGPSMVFTNVFNPRCEFSRKNEYKKTLVKKGATLGANSTILCGITIGEYAFIGAGAVVTADVKPFALMVGNPARHVGWMSRFGKRLNLSFEGEKESVCPNTGDIYRLVDGEIRIFKDEGKE